MVFVFRYIGIIEMCLQNMNILKTCSRLNVPWQISYVWASEYLPKQGYPNNIYCWCGIKEMVVYRRHVYAQ